MNNNNDREKKRNFNYKQVMVVRTDLKMSVGKIAAQVAHAAVKTAIMTNRDYNIWYYLWDYEGFPKIILGVNTLDDIFTLQSKAGKAGIPNFTVKDFGLTELEPNTITCIGIGPAPRELVDEITSGLKLL